MNKKIIMWLLVGCTLIFVGCATQKQQSVKPRLSAAKMKEMYPVEVGGLHAGQIIVNGVPYTNNVVKP